MDGYFDYWGKARADGQDAPCHLLPFHALDVAAIGTELLERDRHLLERIAGLSGFSAASLRSVLPYLLALHDLGKYSEPFQDRRADLVEELQGARQPRPCVLRHDTLGYLLWRDWAAPRPDARESGLLDELHEVQLPGVRLGRSDLDAVMQSWMAAVLAHHGKPPEIALPPAGVFKIHPKGAIARSREDAATFALAARVLLAPGPLESSLEDVDHLIARTKRASWWLAGFTILCDWLGSDTQFFPFEAARRPLDAYWSTAREGAAAAVRHSGLCGSTPRSFGGISGIFPPIASHPTPLQAAAAEIDLGSGPQLFVLEDLTGSGKTEAALILAQRLMATGRGDGLYFALPTMATANAMDGRVRPLLEKLFEGRPSYLLTHSGPRLTEQDRILLSGTRADAAYGRDEQPTATHAASAWLADGRKKALLAELGVGTVDQALLAVLQSKHAALRLFGLHHHVLVVDEVHACDAYMLDVLCTLLGAHAALGGSAILLSATLPLEQRRKLASAFAGGLGEGSSAVPSSQAYPLLTGFGSGRVVERPVEPRAGSPRTLPIRWLGTVEEAKARVIEASRAGQCACWIRNSVKDAVEVFEAVSAVLGHEQVTLFHARFALGDRLRIEQAVGERFGKDGTDEQRRGRVVIATQVVEQSLDIDFDVMVTDLCPVDLLIQRAGRLQRHRRARPRPAPVLEILAPPWCEDPPPGWLGPPFHRTARVYPNPGVLWRTVRELQRLGRITLPGDARELVESVHADATTPPALEPRSSAALGKDLSHASVARSAVIKLDLGYLREGADWSSEARTPTRLGEPTTTVRLARVDEEGARAWMTEAEARHRWPLSQLGVARRLIAKPAEEAEAERRALEETQPFVGDDVVTVLLRRDQDGLWKGRAIAERMRGGEAYDVAVRVIYSEVSGLVVQEGE